jgi:hypothetical protein
MAAPHPKRANRPHVVDHHLRLLGANGADLTVQEGNFIKSVARTGEGAYTITFQQDPGLFVNWNPGFGALVPADLAGYTVVRGVFSAASGATQATLAFVIYNSSFAAADIIADQYLDLTISFSEHGV